VVLIEVFHRFTRIERMPLAAGHLSDAPRGSKLAEVGELVNRTLNTAAIPNGDLFNQSFH
jgi:hypothetical protein